VDKDGANYVEHILRVAVRSYSSDERIVAILHGALEETDATHDALRAAGVTEEQLAALMVLTHADGEPHEVYIDRVSPHPPARRVKFAVLTDNSDPERLVRLDDTTRQRLLAKYEPALKIIRPSPIGFGARWSRCRETMPDPVTIRRTSSSSRA
jgi:hypothetical protein